MFFKRSLQMTLLHNNLLLVYLLDSGEKADLINKTLKAKQYYFNKLHNEQLKYKVFTGDKIKKKINIFMSNRISYILIL